MAWIRSRTALRVSALVATLGLLLFGAAGLANAATTLTGSVSLSTNATGATSVQDTIIAQQTSGTDVNIAGGSVVITLPSNQSIPGSGWSVSDVTTENIPSPGTITQSGTTITIPFTGTLNSGTQITVIVTDLTNGSTAGSASITVNEENSTPTTEATGAYSDSLASGAVTAQITIAEDLAISAVAPSSVVFSLDPATVTTASVAIGGITVLSNAASTAITVAATTPTDSGSGATFPWATSGDGINFTASTGGSALALSTTPTTVDPLAGPTGPGGVTETGTLAATTSYSQEAGVYNTTLTYAATPTY